MEIEDAFCILEAAWKIEIKISTLKKGFQENITKSQLANIESFLVMKKTEAFHF